MQLSSACVPLLGFLETCFGIVFSFKGCAGEKGACMAATVFALSESLWPCALGLAIGIALAWMHAYLQTELESLETEMRCAALQLHNVLSSKYGSPAHSPARGGASGR